MNQADKRCRSFLALTLSNSTIELLSHTLAPIKKQVPQENIRWIPQSNWHITLAFLGNQFEQTLRDLWQRVDNRFCGLEPVKLQIRAISSFPDAKSPIVAALIEPVVHLQPLRTQVAVSCQEVGIKLDKRKFKPHITLGRARKSRHTQMAHPLSKEDTIHFTASKIVLYTSELTSTGSIYTEFAAKTLP